MFVQPIFFNPWTAPLVWTGMMLEYGKRFASPTDVAKTNLDGIRFEEIEEGMTFVLKRTITSADVSAFARLTGDRNRVHLDDEYARARGWPGGRIAHGMLVASYISAALSEFPGDGTIYVSQTLDFAKPVYMNKEVSVTLCAKGKTDKPRRVFFDCACSVDGEPVLRGEATITQRRET